MSPVFQIMYGKPNGPEFEIHLDGCRDVARELKRNLSAHAYRISGASAESVLDSEVANFRECEQDWGLDDFRIMPCARGGA